MTKITIHQPEEDTPISTALFGCNMELTRRTAWSGLYAQMLNNRKFYAVTEDGVSGWRLSGAVRRMDDTENSVCGSHYFCMDTGGTLTITEGTIALEKGREYLFAVYVQGQGTLSCAVNGGEGEGFQSCLSVDTEAAIRLEKRVCAARTLDNGTFALKVTAGSLRVFTVSLLPADHFHQMRRDVVECLKELAPAALRFPGGCLADHYSWKDGLLPVDCRPPIDGREKEFLLRNSYHQDAYEVNIDDFMELCRYVGAQPELTVRLVNAPMQEAVDLVEYCNGAADTHWGALRESRGYAPFQVKNWYVGNEIYMFGHEFTQDGEAAAQATNACIQAMRQVDPTIQTTVTSFSLLPWWNDVYMEKTAPLADFYSYHYYLACQFDPWWQKVTEDMVVNVVENGLLPELEKTWARIQALPAGRHHAVSFDEWNYAWGVPGSTEMMLCNSLVFNFLCAESPQYGVEKALFFHPINEGMIRVEGRSAHLDTTGEVMMLFQAHRGARRLACTVEEDKPLSVACSRTSEGWYITLVNKDFHASQELCLSGEALWKDAVKAEGVVLEPEKVSFDCNEIRKQAVSLPVENGSLKLRLSPAAVAGIAIKSAI